MKEFEDPVVDEVHHTRSRLLERYGGSEGYAAHLRELEAEMANRMTTREPRSPVRTHRKVS